MKKLIIVLLVAVFALATSNVVLAADANTTKTCPKACAKDKANCSKDKSKCPIAKSECAKTCDPNSKCTKDKACKCPKCTKKECKKSAAAGKCCKKGADPNNK